MFGSLLHQRASAGAFGRPEAAPLKTYIAEWGTSTNKSTPRRLTGWGIASRITKRGHFGRNTPGRARQTYVIRLQYTVRHRAVGLASTPRQSGAHPADLR